MKTVLRFPSILFLLSMTLLPGSCIGPRYYGGLVLPDGHLTAKAREYLLAELPSRIKDSGAARIEVAFPGGTVRVLDRQAGEPAEHPDLAGVPTPALAALMIGLFRSTRGSELDLWIPLPDDSRVPITVLHEPDGSVLVQQGAPRTSDPLLGSTVTPEDLRSRYGIAPSDLGEATWTPAHYAALDLALRLLSDEERALISHVPIVREHRPAAYLVEPENSEHVAAMYTRRRGMPRIELYDILLRNDEKLFCGAPDSPLPRSVWSILHEYGHVIADAATADAARNVIASVNSYVHLEDRLAEQRPGPTYGTFLVTPDEHAELQERQARAEAAIDRADRVSGRGPVLRSYRWARRYSNGPTSYGRTSLDESFAEAFAMFHTDPAALRRVDIKAYEWFEHAGHIKAIAE